MQRVRGALKRQDNGISVLFPRRYPHCYQEMQGMRLCHCCALIHELESGSRLMASALLTQSRLFGAPKKGPGGGERSSKPYAEGNEVPASLFRLRASLV